METDWTECSPSIDRLYSTWLVVKGHGNHCYYDSKQESITRSVYLTQNCVLGLWVNRFTWINWINGIQCTLCPYKEDSRFIPVREIGNLETNMAEADLSPTTFTSRSASDWLFDISTEDSSANERATGIEHGLREELLLSPRIGFENYPSRKDFATHFIW